MDRTVNTLIDPDKCTGCELCVKVCPSQTITMKGGKALVTGVESLNCGHCVAACPVDAVTVKSIDDSTIQFSTFSPNGKWLPHGQFELDKLVQLMQSRRSCRNYSNKPVDRNLLNDLVKIGITAPSGSNSQTWTFTILPTRDKVLKLGGKVAGFFKRLNRMSENKYLRILLKLMGKKELDQYYRDYHDRIKQGLEAWEHEGRDILFHGATAVIIIATRPGASCPKEDALLASQNILLAAHAMGLGSCLIGFAVSAMRRDKTVKSFAGIPDEEHVHAVIGLGYPVEKYQRIVGRKAVVQRYVEV